MECSPDGHVPLFRLSSIPTIGCRWMVHSASRHRTGPGALEPPPAITTAGCLQLLDWNGCQMAADRPAGGTIGMKPTEPRKLSPVWSSHRAQPSAKNYERLLRANNEPDKTRRPIIDRKMRASLPKTPCVFQFNKSLISAESFLQPFSRESLSAAKNK